MRILPTTLCVILIGGCNVDRVSADEETLDHLAIHNCPVASGTYERVEIPELISNPGRFDGQPIKISGYYYSSEEIIAIYPNEQDPKNIYGSDYETALWALGVDESFNGKAVTLRGIYDAKGHGHLGQWPGTICVYSATAPEA